MVKFVLHVSQEPDGRLVKRWHCPTIDKYFTSLPSPVIIGVRRTVLYP